MKKLMLDMCCAPCSTHVIEELKHEYEILLIFPNSNIYPKEEYKKRLGEAKKIADIHRLRLIVLDYNHENWLNEIKKVKNYELLKEGGLRCRQCFRFRLKKTVAEAKKQSCSCFTTTLTISPHKDAKTIFSIGKEIEHLAGIMFLDKDFKKNDGFKQSIMLSKEHGLYRQNYCGCEFSINKK